MLGAHQALPVDLTQLALSEQYLHFSRQLRGSEETGEDGAKLDAWLSQLSLRHHFGQGWWGDLVLPAGSIRLEPGGGEPTRRLSGFGDLEVGGGYDFAALWGAGGYSPSLTLRVGLGLPTGRQSTLGEEGASVPPNVLAIGYGAYSGSTELRLTQLATRWLAVSPSASVRKPFGASEQGVQMGTSMTAGAEALLLVPRPLVLGVGAVFEVWTHSEEQGEGRIANSGGRSIAGKVSASVHFGERLTATLGARRPIYTKVNGTQTSETYSVFAALGVTFGGEGDEHEHEHGDHDDDAHDDHGASGAAEHVATGDVADAARGGASFDLAKTLAPGKVTVVDFWADWCHSCRHIEAALRELARKHEGLAVRRVEVPDSDSPVAEQHLGGQSELPLVWIYDAGGKRRAVVKTEAELRKVLTELLK